MHIEAPQLDTGGKFQRDVNHNLPVHMDQYGNVVQVQALVNQGVPQQEVIQQGPEPTFTQPIQDFSQPPNMDLLRANPVIQRLVEERVSVLEAQMKSEFGQGNAGSRKKSGRYNTTETPSAPVFRRWPNESCPTGANRKRTAYDDLSLGQFVIGFITKILLIPRTRNESPYDGRTFGNSKVEREPVLANSSWSVCSGNAQGRGRDNDIGGYPVLSRESPHLFPDGSFQWICYPFT